MQIVGTAWHVYGAGLVFAAGAILSVKIAPLFAQRWRWALFLYLWHTFFCVVYLVYVVNSGGDALMYYRTSQLGDIDPALGTAAVQYLTMFFTVGMGLSLLGTFLAFNVIGFVGLLAFDAALRVATDRKRRALRVMAALVVLLPSASFWSSAIGKDAISFAAAGLALWAALSLRRRIVLLGFAVVLMLIVRPHMAALLVVALCVSIGTRSGVAIEQRLLVGVVALGAAAVLVPFAAGYAGLTGVGVNELAEYIDERQGYNLEGGGGVDISSMSFPAKLFTYLFRPLPFEARNLTSLMASLDNFVLLLLVVAGALGLWRGRRVAIDGSVDSRFLWVYVVSAWVVLSLTTANLGISVRQKWMFVPMLLFLVFSVVGVRKDSLTGVRRRGGLK